ncbi:MAG: hypothetical protein IIW44_02640 [Alistipes sp.]|jgi:CDP-diglyceride synthetase|nr:hypothetical protein [Alistipes sp.]
MADVRIKNVVVNVILLLLGVGNAVAAVFEWYDSAGMLIFNGLCVVLLIAAVMHKVFNMEPRKKWRILSFIMPGAGAIAIFCARMIDSTNSYPQWILPLLAIGSVMILLGAICIVRWRRESLGRKSELQNKRKK